MSRELRARLPQALGPADATTPRTESAIETFKKTSPPTLATIREQARPGTAIEMWFPDEARVGQKNGITRRWARRGTRPSAPQDQRTAWAYIFGAICPKKGKGAALVMPWCNTAAMNAHLAEISAAVGPGAHAVLLLDQAGWHHLHRRSTSRTTSP